MTDFSPSATFNFVQIVVWPSSDSAETIVLLSSFMADCEAASADALSKNNSDFKRL